MLDLSTQVTLPRYELKLANGEVKSYDPILIGYKLQDLEGESEPEAIQQSINTIFELQVDAFQALQILENFTAFTAEHLEEALKKVFGREPSSTTTSDSRPENSENSNQQST